MRHTFGAGREADRVYFFIKDSYLKSGAFVAIPPKLQEKQRSGKIGCNLTGYPFYISFMVCSTSFNTLDHILSCDLSQKGYLASNIARLS